MIDCDCDPCNENPVADVQWGSSNLSKQTATLCQTHLDALWRTLNPLLQTNKAWFRIDEVGKIKQTIPEKKENNG